MNRSALVPALLAAAIALTACAPLQRASYGSWLERVGKPEPSRQPFTAEEAQALRGRADELHARAETVRVEMAREPDRVKRVAHLRELEKIGDELRPIERSLRAGGPETGLSRFLPVLW